MSDPRRDPAEVPAGAEPVVEWTTDDHLLITELQSDWLPTGVAADALVGAPIQRLLPGEPLTPVLDAHQSALAGCVSTFSVLWGERRFVGWVSPVKADGHRICGTAGLAMEVPAQAENLAEPDPDAAALDGMLATLCNDCGWDAAWLWHADRSGKLTALGEWGTTDASERLVLEPYGWLAATTGERQWAAPPGAALIPCSGLPGVAGTLILGITRNEPLPPLEIDVSAIVARLRALFVGTRPNAAASVDREPVTPLRARVRDRWARTVLFGLLLPLPFVVTACFPPP